MESETMGPEINETEAAIGEIPAGVETRAPSRVGKTLRRIGAGIACLPSAALILLGLYGLIFGALRLTRGSALLFFLLPGLVLFLTVRVLRKKDPIVSKVALTILLWALLAFFMLSSGIWTIFLPLETHAVTRGNTLEHFSEEHPRANKLPIPALGEPEEIAFHDCLRLNGLLSETKVSVLLCRYGEDYDARKAALEAGLSFRTEPLKSSDPETHEPFAFDPAVRIGGDLFRFLESRDEYQTWFGKSCEILVTNDETREIALLFYYDSELDYVTDITEFLEYYCCWSMIRR